MHDIGRWARGQIDARSGKAEHGTRSFDEVKSAQHLDTLLDELLALGRLWHLAAEGSRFRGVKLYDDIENCLASFGDSASVWVRRCKHSAEVGQSPDARDPDYFALTSG
jgi:hypothetical protein